VIILRRTRARPVTEEGGEQPPQRRALRPGAAQLFDKRHIDLIENLVARPIQLDDEVGDERTPVDSIEALSA
jgi:hypothetical protein